jgi:4-hydroxy-tetrahydrodipicolinate synthase
VRPPARGDVEARRQAQELDEAMRVLSSFDEGPDLVLFYKHMMVLKGDEAYRLHFNETDRLSDSQRGYCESQFALFQAWYAEWSQRPGTQTRDAA